VVHIVNDVSVSPVIRMIHVCESCHTCVSMTKSVRVVNDASVSPFIHACVHVTRVCQYM